jgi:hypothetical protein
MHVTGTSQRTTVSIFTARGTHRDSEQSLTVTGFLRNKNCMFDRPSKYMNSVSHSGRIYYRPLYHDSCSLLTINEILYLLFSALISTPSPYYMCL